MTHDDARRARQDARRAQVGLAPRARAIPGQVHGDVPTVLAAMDRATLATLVDRSCAELQRQYPDVPCTALRDAARARLAETR